MFLVLSLSIWPPFAKATGGDFLEEEIGRARPRTSEHFNYQRVVDRIEFTLITINTSVTCKRYVSRESCIC